MLLLITVQTSTKQEWGSIYNYVCANTYSGEDQRKDHINQLREFYASIYYVRTYSVHACMHMHMVRMHMLLFSQLVASYQLSHIAIRMCYVCSRLLLAILVANTSSLVAAQQLLSFSPICIYTYNLMILNQYRQICIQIMMLGVHNFET